MNDRLLKESDVLRAVDKRIEELSQDPVFIRKNGPIDLYGIKKYLLVIPSADRPQGEWIDKGRNLWGCSNCGMEIYSESERDRNEFHKWCSRCGARMKGADDE